MDDKIYRQIRANYTKNTIRVYQAYSDQIVDSALKNGTFVSPPFKMERMTWIKPSFLWMMYRSGWAQKDQGQNRILAIDISREGFEYALQNSCISHYENNDLETYEQWQKRLSSSDVRLQWDPERNLLFKPLEYRSIQIGLQGKIVHKYVNEWIQKIEDITPLALEIGELVKKMALEEATLLLPEERTYVINDFLRAHIRAS